MKWSLSSRAILTVLSAGVGFLALAGVVVSQPNASSATDNVSVRQPAASTTPPAGKNRLSLESSPYLLQHADNPVDWYPWGGEAFAKARAEDKPIFLSVGYSTCYWCHVMEREVFENAETAKLMNETVVSVKVDREERPDVDEIYMLAVQLTNGHGGWPMSVLLTPDLEPFFGATYLPNAQFRGLLTSVDKAWKTRRSDIGESAHRLASAMRSYGDRTVGAGAAQLPQAELLSQAASSLAQVFDSEHGGFSRAPKFPQPAQLELLLSDYETNGHKKNLEMVTQTLDAMARGGIHDQIGGGFHRYSTDERWLVPHFEKMLYDNAQLLRTYARAYKLTGNEDFRRVADGIVAYAEREMTGPNGLFYSAQDSEVGEEEGRYYVWSPAEVKALLTKEQYALAKRAWGLDDLPNFERRYILHWPQAYVETAKHVALEPEALFARLEPMSDKLLQVRLKRPRPLTDDKSITGWNGLMIEALAYASRALERPAYADLAKKAAEAILKIHRTPEGALLHVSRHGQAKLAAYLDDYAAMILALNALHRATGGMRWRVEAHNLADRMIADLWDQVNGGFFHASAEVEHLILRSKDSYDGAVPSGNSLASKALTELAAENAPRYAAYAADTFRAFAPGLRSAPGNLPSMVVALHEYRARKLPDEVRVANEPPALQKTSSLVAMAAGLMPTTQENERTVNVRLEMQPGWHINANPASMDFLVPTSVSAKVGSRSVALEPVYPKGKIISSALGDIRVYTEKVIIPARLAVSDLRGGGTLTVSVRAQACNDEGRCLASDVLSTDISLSHAP